MFNECQTSKKIYSLELLFSLPRLIANNNFVYHDTSLIYTNKPNLITKINTLNLAFDFRALNELPCDIVLGRHRILKENYGNDSWLAPLRLPIITKKSKIPL